MKKNDKKIIRVGIIEDDPMVSLINKRYTEKIDQFVVTKEINLDKGMDFNIKSLKKLDLILLDIFLPKKNGIQILKCFLQVKIPGFCKVFLAATQ